MLFHDFISDQENHGEECSHKHTHKPIECKSYLLFQRFGHALGSKTCPCFPIYHILLTIITCRRFLLRPWKASDIGRWSGLLSLPTPNLDYVVGNILWQRYSKEPLRGRSKWQDCSLTSSWLFLAPWVTHTKDPLGRPYVLLILRTTLFLCLGVLGMETLNWSYMRRGL